MLRYQWPRHTREMENIIGCAVILQSATIIEADHLTINTSAGRIDKYHSMNLIISRH